MEKTVKYRATRFAPEVIREAANVLERAARPAEGAFRSLRLSVQLDQVAWEHDSEDEFFTDYRASSGEASYRLSFDQHGLSLTAFRDGETRIGVRAPDRAAIEAVVEVFERARAASALPEQGRPAQPLVTRERTVSREFYRLRISENDLVRIASLAQNAVAPHNGVVMIELQSADGEELIRTSDAGFLTSPGVPPTVSHAAIRFSHYEAPVGFSVVFPGTPRGPARLTVEGTDPQVVSGLFRELERELQGLTLPGQGLLRQVDTYIFFLVVTLIVGAAVYAAADVILRILTVAIPGFKGSSAQRALATVAWVLVFTLPFFGGSQLVDAVRRAFPAVEFHGRLADPGAGNRKRLTWIALAIALPLVLNLVASLIFKSLE